MDNNPQQPPQGDQNQPEAPAQPTPVQPAQEQPVIPPSAPVQAKASKKPLIIGLVVVLLLAALGGAYYFLNSDDQQANQSTAQDTTVEESSDTDTAEGDYDLTPESTIVIFREEAVEAFSFKPSIKYEEVTYWGELDAGAVGLAYRVDPVDSSADSYDAFVQDVKSVISTLESQAEKLGLVYVTETTTSNPSGEFKTKTYADKNVTCDIGDGSSVTVVCKPV